MGKKTIEGFELTFSSDWTKKIESRDHWIYYWRQASLVDHYIDSKSKVLEIGVGSGFLQNYLKSRGWDAFSVDIDEDKNPDFVSDASIFNFNEVSPDCFLAFEIFEHIPFPLFLRTVKNITKSGPDIIIFSLPVSLYFIFELRVKLPRLGVLDFKVPAPKFKIKTPNHFWELCVYGSSDPGVLSGTERGTVSLKDIKNIFNKCAYSVEEVAREGRIKFFVAHPIADN